MPPETGLALLSDRALRQLGLLSLDRAEAQSRVMKFEADAAGWEWDAAELGDPDAARIASGLRLLARAWTTKIRGLDDIRNEVAMKAFIDPIVQRMGAACGCRQPAPSRRLNHG